MIIAWGIQPVKDTLNSIGYMQFEIPGLHNLIHISVAIYYRIFLNSIIYPPQEQRY